MTCPAHDLDRLARQAERLTFPRFDEGTAWELATRLRADAERRGTPISVEVRLAGQTVVFFAMPGTSPGNADWARRKRNTVELLQKASYRLGGEFAHGGNTLEGLMGLPLRDYCDHGGAVPIRVDGIGMVGVVTVSGLPQREDHEMAVAAIAGLCGVPVAEVALDGADA